MHGIRMGQVALHTSHVRSSLPRLHGTPASHFTRKLRILLSEIGIQYEFVRTPSVLSLNCDDYGRNPLLRVPFFEDGDVAMWESDSIARYVARKYDPADRFTVLSESVQDANIQSVINSTMSNEVVLLLTERSGGDITGIPYMQKLDSAIHSGLAYLEEVVTKREASYDYRDISLICLWDHLVHNQWKGLEQYPRIQAHVSRFAVRPAVAASTPRQSLLDASAAGWPLSCPMPK